MKTMKTIAVVGSMAFLAVSSASAQDPRAVQNNTYPVQPTTRPLANDYRGQPGDNFLTKANKATGLIGMDVRNPQNEKLGDIKDLVVDLHTGKIGYAVLSVGGFLGIGDKYIAVPPSEFSLSPDGKELILNADKARLESAPGFAKNNWPAFNDPSWSSHMSYWRPNGTAMGTAGVVGTGRESGGTLRDANYATFSGHVVAINGLDRTVTVQGPSGKHQFQVSAPTTGTTGTLRTDSNAMLDNLKVGDMVTVRYYNHNGSYVAESISDSHRK